MDHLCPLCNGSFCYNAGMSTTGRGAWFDCKEFKTSIRVDSDIEICNDLKQKARYYNLIFEHCINNSSDNDDPWFYYVSNGKKERNVDKKAIDLNNITYPQTLSEKTDRILLTLSRMYPNYEEEIPGNYKLERAFFCEESDQNVLYLGIVNIIIDMGYLRKGDYQEVVLTAKGWQRIDEAARRYDNNLNCFIAMAFREETEPIRRSIKIAVQECGYNPIIMDEVEYNGQIVPEMLYEIRRCRFLIMDATTDNLGAYYEAGYAAGQGKQVILCCRGDKLDSDEKPHFDIQQQSTVKWENETELVEKLKKRIEATIGRPGYNHQNE